MENSTNEYHDRLRKLNDIKEKGINPYPAKFERSHTSSDCIKLAEDTDLRSIETILKKPAKKLIKLAGRLTAFRSHGKISFGNLQDFEGSLQVCFMQDILLKDSYKFLKKIDIADFLGLTGELFETKHGELTLLVYKYTLLSKSLMPLPEKWHGIKGQEHKYRQRYLDLIMNRDTMDRFIFRSNFIKALREFYWDEGFVEIETPYLENVSGGAVAKPFITHHNALDIDMYLRIAGGELWQKTAIVGGFEKTFEIARCFRNEGMDPSHLQEFTMVEHYCAFWDAETNMQFTERMFEHLLLKLFGKTKVTIKDREGNDTQVDFKAPWPRKEYTKMIKEDCGIDVLEFYGDEEALLKEITKKGIKIEDAENLGYGNLVDSLYKRVSRPKLIQPCFVVLHPTDTKPLARKNDDDPRLADSFQVLVNTWEVVNAYGEIVDPIDQRERFEAQALAKAKGDEEAMMVNEEYLTTMSHGMPCMSGWGMGIDRMVTLLTEQENLKDTVLFPIMKPLEEHSKKNKKVQDKARKIAKKKKSNG